MLLSVALAAALASNPTPVQEGQEPPPVMLLLEANGGLEAVEALERVSFGLKTWTFPDAIEGQATPEPVVADELKVSLLYLGGAGRRSRIEQAAGDNTLVRISGVGGSKAWIDGQPKVSAELSSEARAMTGEVFVVLDLVWGLLNGQLLPVPSGRRTRNGINYFTITATFPEGREVEATYLLYINPGTGFVDRVDVYDSDSLRRQSTIHLTGYAGSGPIKAPTSILFVDRDMRSVSRWDFTGMTINPAWPETFFEQP